MWDRNDILTRVKRVSSMWFVSVLRALVTVLVIGALVASRLLATLRNMVDRFILVLVVSIWRPVLDSMTLLLLIGMNLMSSTRLWVGLRLAALTLTVSSCSLDVGAVLGRMGIWQKLVSVLDVPVVVPVWCCLSDGANRFTLGGYAGVADEFECVSYSVDD